MPETHYKIDRGVSGARITFPSPPSGSENYQLFLTQWGGDSVPEVHYPDTVAESWKAESKRLEETLADVRHRLQFAEGRLRTELDGKQLLKETNARLKSELDDANNRLARLRSGGKA